MKRIMLLCPVCGETKLYKIPTALLEKWEAIDEGLVPILIKKITCEHTFVAYVDYHWRIRRFMPADFDAEFPHLFKIERQRFEQHLLILEPPKILANP